MQTRPQFVTGLYASRHAPIREGEAAAWRVEDVLIFVSALYGTITVPRGFLTDFASVPRLPFAYLFFGDRAHAAAVIHDWLCRVEYPACRISWRLAADVFLEAMKAEGVPLWQRLPMYMAVRFAGSLKKDDCPERKQPAQAQPRRAFDNAHHG